MSAPGRYPLTKVLLDRITARMNALNISKGELKKKARLSSKTIESVLGLKNRWVNGGTLAAIAKVLDTTIRDLLGPDHGARQSSSFTDLYDLTKRVDDALLVVVRNQRNKTVVPTAYWNTLHGQAYELGVDPHQLLDALHEEEYLDKVVNTAPLPGLTITVNRDREVVIYGCANGEIDVPLEGLLWECSCHQPEAGQDCPIHYSASGLGPLIAQLFDDGYTAIFAEHVRTLWKNSNGLWPPSIDSLQLIRTLREFGYMQKPVRSVLDLGSGTGFLGLCLARENPHVARLVLSDWLLAPALFGLVNCRMNMHDVRHVSTEYALGLYTDWRHRDDELPFDLVVCNPPYLVVPEGFTEITLESTVAGTDLLEHLIEHAPEVGKNVVVQFSSLASQEANTVARRYRRTLRPLGSSSTIPFRSRTAFEHPDYLQWLLEEGRIRHDRGRRHQYTHQIQAYVVE